MLGDHPRRCGAYIVAAFALTFPEGSPPQVRGILGSKISSAVSSRITPAGAGHTFAILLESTMAWDHPRRCGAYGGFYFF